MFRASLRPSSAEQECALPHTVFCTGCDDCGCVELGCKLCALWRLLFDSSHHYQCRTPYAAVHIIVLLMMGTMMPETCWDSLIINIRLVASCWFLSLHPKFMMHGHKSLKWSTCINVLWAGGWGLPCTKLTTQKVCSGSEECRRSFQTRYSCFERCPEGGWRKTGCSPWMCIFTGFRSCDGS